jgi:SAM-dependent methyltransferase
MNDSHHRLKRLKSILACPRCERDLSLDSQHVSCKSCFAIYPIRNGKIYFVNVTSHKDDLDNLKGHLKRWLGKYYYKVGVYIVAPTYPFNYARKICRRMDPSKHIVIDVGCGNHRIHEDIIGLDFLDYEAVDLVCDLSHLPFKPNSVDAFVSRSVLEHVNDPSGIIKQLYRCTKEGGLSMHLIPFLFPFHASPYDFQRYTHKGHETLFEGWEVVEQFNPTGPVTLALLCIIEFLSILMSMGNEKAKGFIYLGLCAILFPFKYMDVIFVNRKSFLSLAPTIFTVARKRDEAQST